MQLFSWWLKVTSWIKENGTENRKGDGLWLLGWSPCFFIALCPLTKVNGNHQGRLFKLLTMVLGGLPTPGWNPGLFIVKSSGLLHSKTKEPFSFLKNGSLNAIQILTYRLKSRRLQPNSTSDLFCIFEARLYGFVCLADLPEKK